MGARARSLALLALAAAGCPGGDGDDGGEDTVLVAQAVTCDPALERYPIAAPHNGGYDRAWSNFTCAPHPGGSPDNSDYGGDHHGNDLFAPRGAPVVAVRAGRVTRAGVVSSTSGQRVTVEDSCGWSYYFGHLDTIEPGIVVGARVVAGQRLGTVGNTGALGTAPHVHFNVHRDGNYNNDVDPYPLLRAADATACDPTATPGTPPPATCAPACEGSTLVSRDCGRGDCAAYGSGCVSDSLGPRCVFFACPAQGEQDTCWLGRYIGHCRSGALVSQGDCGRFGATCMQDGATARCGFAACAAPGEYDACLFGRYVTRCRGGVAGPPGDCGAYGASCVDDSLGARCVFFACPAQGERDVCWLGRYRGRCLDGQLTAQADCGAQGARCVDDDGGARCVSTVCPATRGDVTFCVAPGRVARCAEGMFVGYDADCTATGATCAAVSATTARCVRPGEPPPPPFDAGPPPAATDAGPPRDLGFALPDAWVPRPPDAALPTADVSVGVDVPPAADVLLPADVAPYFVPDAGAMAAEVEGAAPPVVDDGKDPCATCRPLGRCPPQCDADAGAAADASGDGLVGPGCSCRAAGDGSARSGGGLGALACALGLAIVRRRTTSRRSRSRG